MAFSGEAQGANRYYNNADSFAMAFDDAWKQSQLVKNNSSKNAQEKLEIVLLEVKEHPFFLSNPKEAKQIGEFRLRLLNLQ